MFTDHHFVLAFMLQLYQNLQASLLQIPGVMERPTWWSDIVGGFKAKL